MRLRNIDLLKGLLIFLVVVGHITLGDPSENLFRYTIYSFHMPLFIGISGFLFNVDKIRALSFSEVINKYLFRMLIPWAIAMTVYNFIPHFEDRYSLPSILFFIPFYHLWFVAAYLAWILGVWSLLRLNLSLKTVVVIGALLSISTMLLLEYPQWYSTPVHLSHTIEFLLRTFKPFFFIFFVLGMVLKRIDLKKHIPLAALLTIIGFGASTALYFYPSVNLTIVLFFAFNGILLLLMLALAQIDALPHSKGVEWMGKNSMAIYLWHMVPLILVQYYIGEENPSTFYAAVIPLSFMWLALTVLLSKNRHINRILFGI